MFRAVRTPRVYEHIVAQIERAIYEGRLAHGDKLPPERQLVREFGASRVAVREALRALEHRGLVEVRQGSAGGYFIRELDATTVVRDLSTLFRLGRVSLVQVAEARALLEPESARLAAARATDHELKRLGECLVTRTAAWPSGGRHEVTPCPRRPRRPRHARHRRALRRAGNDPCRRDQLVQRDRRAVHRALPPGHRDGGGGGQREGRRAGAEGRGPFPR